MTAPELCATCAAVEPCVHRATQAAHLAYRAGVLALASLPLGFQESPACPYPPGSDGESWWQRGFQAELRRWVAADRKSTIIELCRSVGAKLAEARFNDGSHLVECQPTAALWRQYGVCGGVICTRVWTAALVGWGAWQTPTSLAAGDFALKGRTVPREQGDRAPDELR